MKQVQQRWRWTQLLALGWLSAVGVAALLAPSALVTPDLLHTSQPPFQASYWFGTDPQGQDVGRALLQGARTIFLVSFPATVLTLLLGSVLGSAAGFWDNSRYRFAAGAGVAAAVLGGGCLVFAAQLLRSPGVVLSLLLLGSAAVGWVLRRTRWGQQRWALPIDALVSGLLALLDSIPLLILVLVVASVQRPSAGGLVLLMALTCWTTPARIMRAATLQAREQVYVEAARAIGLTDFQLLRRHIWPATWHVQLVRFPLTMAFLIGLETTLSFLGVGLPTDMPSWGRLLAAIRLDPAAWWLVAWPGSALALTILSLHSLGGPKRSRT
ncbi:hypothetical protein GCM10027346_13500 [Hymenobacter seoulensis]